ncbi:MAG: hypothetical protein ACRC5Q_05090 [Culicoidibacterales bacterium]
MYSERKERIVTEELVLLVEFALTNMKVLQTLEDELRQAKRGRLLEELKNWKEELDG